MPAQEEIARDAATERRFVQGLRAMSVFRFGVLFALLYLAPLAADPAHWCHCTWGALITPVAIVLFAFTEYGWYHERLNDFREGRAREKVLGVSGTYSELRDTIARADIGFDVSPIGPIRVCLFGALLIVGFAMTFRSVFAPAAQDALIFVTAAVAGTILGPMIEALLIRPIFRSLSANIGYYGRLARIARLDLDLKDLSRSVD
jgi:hypothetical protein